MGRYTTVQAYSDQNSRVAKVSYAEASGSAASAAAAAAAAATPQQQQLLQQAKAQPDSQPQHLVRPETVDNVMGSCAGSGSGDFHIYRAARRREAFRQSRMDAQAKQQAESAVLAAKCAAFEKEADERTAKKRKKRQARKQKKLLHRKRQQAEAREARKRPEDEEKTAKANGEEERQAQQQAEDDNVQRKASGTEDVETGNQAEEDEEARVNKRARVAGVTIVTDDDETEGISVSANSIDSSIDK